VLAEYNDPRLTPVSEVTPEQDGQSVILAGMLDAVRTIVTRKGEPMAFAQIEDLSGAIELVVFPRCYESAKSLLVDGQLSLIEGRVNMRDEKLSIVVESIAPYTLPKEATRRYNGSRRPARILVDMSVNGDSSGDAQLARQVLDVLAEQEGDVPYVFRLVTPYGRVTLDFPGGRTCYSAQLEDRVAALVGRGNLRVEWA